MLSVAQAAQQLGVSTARVRALIASQLLPAQKVGRAWLVREEDVLRRQAMQPKAGRPKRGEEPHKKVARARAASPDYHALYIACREAAAASAAPAFATPDEEAFFETVSAFFARV